MVAYICAAVAGYLLGSVPTGFLVARARGIDIRTLGSGNIGATNVFRILGTPAGVLVLLVDALKGWLAVVVVAAGISQALAPNRTEDTREWLRMVGGFCSILGHNYTCWLHFRGGKGIATSAGVLAGLVPLPLAIIFSIWALVLGLTRYMSLASVAASLALPFATWLTGYSGKLIGLAAVMAALAIYRHKSNVQRLLKGTENRFDRKSPPPGPTASTQRE